MSRAGFAPIAILVAGLAVLATARPARAQGVDTHYAGEPTGGGALPTPPLAGDQDARAVVVNPGGLPLLTGPDLVLAADVEDSSVATSAGPGFGTYLATVGGGTL